MIDSPFFNLHTVIGTDAFFSHPLLYPAIAPTSDDLPPTPRAPAQGPGQVGVPPQEEGHEGLQRGADLREYVGRRGHVPRSLLRAARGAS